MASLVEVLFQCCFGIFVLTGKNKSFWCSNAPSRDGAPWPFPAVLAPLRYGVSVFSGIYTDLVNTDIAIPITKGAVWFFHASQAAVVFWRFPPFDQFVRVGLP